jgi:hypothetical protein
MQYFDMDLQQEIRFVLDLSLAESYIYGTATIYDMSYSINIQQAAQQLVVLPKDSFYIEASSRASVSFGCSLDNYNTESIVTSEIMVGEGDIIEIYLNQDNVLLALAHELPVQILLQVNPGSM